MKKNILSSDEVRDTNEITNAIEALEVMAKNRKMVADLAKLDAMAAETEPSVVALDNQLAALRDALADTDPEGLAELSANRVRLTAKKVEKTGLLADLKARKGTITKEQVKIQLAISDQARAIVERVRRRETEETTALVAVIEDRLKTWETTVNKVHMQYMRGIGFEMLTVLESIRFFAPLVKKSLTSEPVR